MQRSILNHPLKNKPLQEQSPPASFWGYFPISVVAQALAGSHAQVQQGTRMDITAPGSVFCQGLGSPFCPTN